MLRGVSECVHAKSRGHSPGAVQRHLQTTASTGVADTLPRSAGDLSHMATVWTTYDTLSCVHRSAASGASSAAVRASLAQCSCPPDLVRAPLHPILESPFSIFIRSLHPFPRAVFQFLQDFSRQAPFCTPTFGIPIWGPSPVSCLSQWHPQILPLSQPHGHS